MSRWVRYSRRHTAVREDGLTVVLEGFQWVTRLNGKSKLLTTEGAPAFLERAIREVDEKIAPRHWRFVEGTWIRENWKLVEGTDGEWGIFRASYRKGDYVPASSRRFPTADRARAWCDVRMDRGEAGLRGPKPRNGLRATAKLPDVRVTQEEKDHALDVLAKIGLSYAEFVRASVLWAEENVGVAWRVANTDSGPVFAVSSPEESEAEPSLDALQ